MTRRPDTHARLLRFVLDPEGRVRFDVHARLPGRGMWLSAERDVVEKAVRRNVFARSARAQVAVDASLVLEVERVLVGRGLNTLGLARRAGLLVLGFEQVKSSVAAGAAAVLVSAADGAADGVRKVRWGASDLPVVRAFSREELGAALGRPDVVHAAVLPGRMAERLLDDVARLGGFRPGALEGPAIDRDAGRNGIRGTTGPA